MANIFSYDTISETSYLTAENAVLYRVIMRIFYAENEKAHYQLDKDYILLKLHANAAFAECGMTQLVSALDQPVKWKNLTPIQNPSHANTIADYLNNQYSYIMSAAAAEIERMTIKLETLFLRSGSLSTRLFSQFYNELDQLEQLQFEKDEIINEWWQGLQELFERLNQNYQDYLREFYSSKAELIMRSTEFISYKDHVITYLKDFVRELQLRAGRIEKLLCSLPEDLVQSTLARIANSEVAKPRPVAEKQDGFDTRIRENVSARWQSILLWFVGTANTPSTSKHVMETTNEVIRKIIQNANFIIQMQGAGVSRKSDYKKLMQLFAGCNDVKEAHCISAHVFGVQTVRHYVANFARMSDSVNDSTYDEAPRQFTLRSHARGPQLRIDKRGFEDKRMEKEMLRQELLAEQQRQRELVLRYIKDGKLDFAQLPDEIEPFARDVFLHWISLASSSYNGCASTEYGQKYHLHKRQERCTMHCTDGDLVMPSHWLEFEEEESGE